MTTINPILKLLIPYKKELIIGPLCKLIEAICELCLPLCLATLIDQGILKHQPTIVIKQVILMLILSIIGLIFVYICQKMAAHVSLSFGESLRNQLFSALIHSKNDSDEELIMMTNDTVQLQFAVAMLIRLVIRAPFLCIASIILAFSINRTISLIFLSVLPLFLITIIGLMKKNMPQLHRIQHALSTLNTSLFEVLIGQEVIMSARKETMFAKQLDKQSQTIKALSEKYNRVASKMTPMTTLILNTAMVLLLLFSYFFVQKNALAIGDVVALSNYLTQMLLALTVITNLMLTFSKAYVSYQRLTKAMTAIEEKEATDTHTLSSCHTLSLCNIDYRYSKETPIVLNQFSLSIHSGGDLAITGPVGSGKTTLLKIITRQLIETNGEILINGKRSSIKATQSLLSYVPQEAILFKDSIKNNLLFANPCASEKELWQALHIACLDEFVQKVGLAFQLEHNGNNLSGGQKQRLAIARSLLKPNISFLIMDDPFSALDFQTEQTIYQRIKKYFPKLTLVIVSQHKKTLRQWQTIAVIEHGKLTGYGSPHYLSKNNDYYQRLIGKEK